MVNVNNVLFIVADTFRHDNVHPAGAGAAHTPHLDRFAASALVLENHRLSSFPTMPARADIHLGSFAFNFMGWEPLPPARATLAQTLSQNGVRTNAIVDVPFYVRNGWGYDRGFGDFIWVRGQGDYSRPDERRDVRRTWLSEADRFAPRVVSEAEDWLERNYRERFFLFVDMWDPHEPWDAPDYFTAHYWPGDVRPHPDPCYGKWQECGLTMDDVERARAAYLGEVTMVDRSIGRLLEKIDLLGLRDETAIVFASDHGFYFGEHGYFGKAHWGEGLLDNLDKGWMTMLKRSPLYEEVAHVPLIARVPGIPAGQRAASTTAADLAPTIIDLMGFPVPEEMTGSSFAKVMTQENTDHRDIVVSAWPMDLRSGRITAAVDSRHRIAETVMPITVTSDSLTAIVGGDEAEPELYDLETDPRQEQNLWQADPAIGTELLTRATAFLLSTGADPKVLAARGDRWSETLREIV